MISYLFFNIAARITNPRPIASSFARSLLRRASCWSSNSAVLNSCASGCVKALRFIWLSKYWYRCGLIGLLPGLMLLNACTANAFRPSVNGSIRVSNLVKRFSTDSTPRIANMMKVRMDTTVPIRPKTNAQVVMFGSFQMHFKRTDGKYARVQ